MAENEGLFGRVKEALKDSAYTGMGNFGSVGRYYQRKRDERQGLTDPDEAPMTFRKQVSQDMRRGAASRTGTLGKAIFNPKEEKNKDTKKNSKASSDSVTTRDNQTASEYSALKQQNSAVNQNITALGSRLKKIDDVLEDILLSQERVEVAVNRLLYKKEPPPVVQQTVNNNTYNTVNNNTNNAGGIVGGGGGGGAGKGKGKTPGRIPGLGGRAGALGLGALGLGSLLGSGGEDGGDGEDNTSSDSSKAPDKKFIKEAATGPQLNPTTYKYWQLNNPQALGNYYRLSDADKVKANELAMRDAGAAEKFMQESIADMPAVGAKPAQFIGETLNDGSSATNLAFAGLGVAADVAGMLGGSGTKNNIKPVDISSPTSETRSPWAKAESKTAGASTSKWSKFLAFLEKKAPNLMAKIGPRLVSMGAGMTIPGPGWIWTAINVIGNVSLAWEVYELWKEFNGQTLSETKRPNKVGQTSEALQRGNQPPLPPDNQNAASGGASSNNASQSAASTATATSQAASGQPSEPALRQGPKLENNSGNYVTNPGGAPNVQAAASGATAGLNQTQPMRFTGSNSEAFAKMEQAAKAAGSPDPKVTAAIAMLESGWLKSSMTQRANNPFGQTITQAQIGKDGIVGGTRGADGQLHAVYDSLESAVKHHVRRWGSRYSGDAETTLKNLVAGGYNTVNPTWASKVYSIYSGGGGSRQQGPAGQDSPQGRPNRQQGPTQFPDNQGRPGREQGPTGPESPQGTPGREQGPITPDDNQGRPNRQQGPTQFPENEGRRQQGGMVTLKTPGGRPYQVAAEYAKNFEGFVNELEGSGYKIKSIGGYANRSTASGGFSWHSKGMAIDINPSENPHTFPGSQNYGKTDMPANVGAMAAKHGLGWGGNWRSSKDTMHFSMGGNEGGSSNEARGGQMAKGGENEGRQGAGAATGGSYQPTPGGSVTGLGAGGAMGGMGMMGGNPLGGMLGMGMMGGRGMGMGMMGGRGMGLGGLGGMLGSMLGGRAGPMGSMLGGMLGSTLGNLGQSLISQPVNTGSNINTRSTNMDIARDNRRSGPVVVSPQDNRTYSTPSEKRFGIDGIPSASPGGGFAEVLAGGIAGALVESLGSNSVSVNRRARAGSMVS